MRSPGSSPTGMKIACDKGQHALVDYLDHVSQGKKENTQESRANSLDTQLGTVLELASTLETDFHMKT